MGEIDLVMTDANCVVFVEVRYRAANRFATAAGSIDHRKQVKIRRTAAYFLGRHRELADCPVRFDVIALDGADAEQCTLQWTRDAFRA
jgi:putative endonuclease